MRELVVRKLTPENKKRLTEATHKILDFMKDILKLEEWEMYFAIDVLYKSMPIEDVERVVEK